jgi:TolB-like protein/tRNA A-37 threonylcarbamoyl transferase component Bud32
MIGKTISHYRIVEKLGEGGMGVVYKAEDTKLHRAVALKFLPPEFTRDAAARERFVREALAAAALDHPDICTIYEIDEAEGQAFISMAYVDGERLKDKIERGPLKVEEVLDIAVHVAQGLQAAHEKGIVHRDIKSANIMLTVSGQVKVMDFGLAKLAGATMVTREGTTLGTAGYMSPEQARGEEADSRTDIWSLGVVLHEMLTGLLPFRGEYEQALVFQILNAAPETITSLRTGVPMELERIVLKCLEKDRAERYQTAADLIADLRHLQRTMGAVPEVTQRSMAGAAAPARRLRWWYWVAPLMVVAIIVAVALIKMPRRASVPAGEKSVAVLPFVDMSPQRDQEYFCDGMTEELINRLSNIKDLRVPARTSAFFFKGKTEDIREVGTKLNVQTVLEGSVRKAGNELRITAQLINVADGYHMWSETYDRELKDVFAIQDEISSAIVNALQLKLSSQEQQRLSEHPMDNVKAYECYLRASRQVYRFDEKSLDSALVYLRTAIDIMGDNAELYAGMSQAYSQYANIGMGQEEYLERAKEYAEKALALKPDLPSALVELGVLSAYGDYPESRQDAFRYNKKALAASPFSSEALRSIAIDYAQIGRPSEALAYADMFAQHDQLNPWWHAVKGLCYQYDCRFGPAVEQFRAFFQADSTSPLAQDLYSWALVCNGERDEALAVLKRVGSTSGRNVETIFCNLLKYALLKDSENALRLMTPDFQKTCRRDFEWSYYVAAFLSLLGAKEEALDWLENSINRGFINYPYFQCDPYLDNIRGEERFKKLMERVKYEWEHFEVPE